MQRTLYNKPVTCCIYALQTTVQFCLRSAGIRRHGNSVNTLIIELTITRAQSECFLHRHSNGRAKCTYRSFTMETRLSL